MLYDEARIGVPFWGLVLIEFFWICVGGILWPDDFTTEPTPTVFIVAASFITLWVVRTFSWQILSIPCGIIIIIFIIYTFKDRF